MMPLFRTSFEVEGLAPYRALDKLAKRGISVFGVQKLSPTRLKMRVKSKEMQKVFAIFSGSCYTVTKVRRESFSRLRAALLRTLLTEREVLLLDEPFGALDALTRLQLQLGLTDVWQTFHKTILLVTHDVEEAIFLSDQILVLSPRPGRVRRQLTVPLPRPRTVDMLASPEVMGMKKELLELLLQEEGTGHESNG